MLSSSLGAPMTLAASDGHYDTIVIGSGFGGSMIAHGLVRAGERVLMLERGDWVRRGPHNWDPGSVMELTPFYTTETPYRVPDGQSWAVIGGYSCVGGPSVFNGAVSLRLREADLTPEPSIVGDSGARWPFDYAALEPYYCLAEQLLDVSGETGQDPTEPFRTAPYPQAPAELSSASRIVDAAARRLGLRPFRLPLAINYRTTGDRLPCAACTTCDCFACAIQAKNDLATCILPDLIRRGLCLKANTVAVHLVTTGRRVVAVECFDKSADRSLRFSAERFVLSAGALASPHLLLASGLEALNPGGHTVGRYLMRHCNAIVFGFFPRRPDPERQFHKQLAMFDFYFGHPSVKYPTGKLGVIQQVHTPPIGLVRAYMPKALRVLTPGINHLTGLIVIAEDQPRYENYVAIDRSTHDRFGLPQLTINHRYTARDLAARHALINKSKQIFRKAGAYISYVHRIHTFSHAVGSVRMGGAAASSALDPECRFRGVDNLYVVDGSFMPTSSGVNPSLTIAANALRVADHLTGAYTPANLARRPTQLPTGAPSAAG